MLPRGRVLKLKDPSSIKFLKHSNYLLDEIKTKKDPAKKEGNLIPIYSHIEI